MTQRTSRLHRKFIAVIAALAIAVTAFGTGKATAGDRDTERALAALLGLAVVGAIIADKKKRDDDHFSSRDRDDREYRRPAPRVIEPRPLPRHVSRKLLPAQCLRVTESRQGRDFRYFAPRCLERNYRFSEGLPHQCTRELRTHRGYRSVYSARCLRQNGYEVARR